jgi:thioredoxin reductase/NAD-dependent dihydropyrimidine dehydrogenase PreA subunit
LVTWLLLIGAAVAVYVAWGVRDRQRHRRDHEVHEELADLGDELVPTSLHPLIDTGRCIGSGACVSACPEEHVLGMIQGQAKLINPLACIGHGACMAACPVQAITLVFGTATRGVELPRVDPHFETNQPGVYVVGELGGMGLIRNAVEQGRQAAAHIAAGPRRGGAVLDALVVGAGPAGMGAALELGVRGLRAEIVEEGELGGAIRHYPRAKVVMTGALELPGLGRVRGKTMSKEELGALWQEVVASKALIVHEHERVTGLRRAGDAWIVSSTVGERRAANVVLALGRRGAPRRLGVPGEDLPKVSYRVLEPQTFAGQHVLVVGGGNAAADCAIALVEEGRCASVSLSYRRPELARLRGGVRQRVEALAAHGRLRKLLPTEVVAIAERSVTLAGRDGRREELPNDAVIVHIGGTSPVELLATFGIETVEKFAER